MASQTGNLLDATRGIIVHGCNAQGKMASGVAKDVRARYPQAYDAYMKEYETNGLKLGKIVWVRVSDNPLLGIANAITQQFYGRDPNRVYVNYDAVATVFDEIGKIARKHSLPVHYPKIGAGLGNGDWSIIEPIINNALEGVEHHLWLPPGTNPSWSRQHP